MWAAYQGDALSVELLLKHGASVAVRDNAGLTPLHWAVVRGNKVRAPSQPLVHENNVFCRYVFGGSSKPVRISMLATMREKHLATWLSN